MDKWVKLETRLRKKNTIDKEIQEQINKEKEHWEKVLVRITTLIKYFSKNNLAFRGTNEKIYQKGNENFLSLINLLVEFDPIMQKHVKRIKNGDLHNHYLSKNQGVQKRLLDINPRAYYTPCGCHNLNLVLGDMANSCTRVVSFFGVLQHIYSLFASSTKRWKILQENVSKFSIKSLSQTIWECRIESVKAIKFQAPKISDTLVQLSKTSEDPKIKSVTICLATYEMENFEYLLGMTIWYDILFVVNLENGFAFALESTKEMTIEMDIEPKFNEKCKIHRKNHFDDIVNDEIAHLLKIESYLRSTMLQDRLNELAMLSIEMTKVVMVEITMVMVAMMTMITTMLVVAAMIEDHGGGYGDSHDSYGENDHYDGNSHGDDRFEIL
ncbi:hypothetical protein GLYMA_18G183000v4 [Glycine max]|uniref:DUF4371 domain-containing protein n=1 Tax=Glycine max TaxID=3847 RepID=A0A0R0F1R3_SOYBN|nr:hypothetical protein GYH30_050370 [Glycine max]KRG99981.1 hypothetical protein GLYMA_18G183000v4 [Glycine max]